MSSNFSRCFWAKVDKSGECWLWTGPINKGGYGTIGKAGSGGITLAHRFAYADQFGPIQTGLAICHHCDVPACVRPDHLFAGTLAENNADMQRKGRASGGTRGEQQWMAMLTDEQVREMRRQSDAGRPAKEIAKDFGIQYQLAWKVVTRRC